MQTLFDLFSVAVTACGILAVIWLVFALAQAALTQVLSVAALLEAAHEARRQGRAPILRAWLRRSPDYREPHAAIDALVAQEREQTKRLEILANALVSRKEQEPEKGGPHG